MISVVRCPVEFSEACAQARSQGKRVALVPTMGALHQGHLSLIDAARSRADFIVLTIFVNPLQFAPGEDLQSYPRTLEQDLVGCEEQGVDLVFTPNNDQMYPKGFQSQVRVLDLTQRLEGAHRPSHFDGVTTVVTKLFNLTGPCVALFGTKDYQQYRIVHAMARDLDMPVNVIGCPIIRESDGLALSSRNRYLSKDERQRALGIVQGLRRAHDAFADGQRCIKVLRDTARVPIAEAFDKIDYVRLVNPDTLDDATDNTDTLALVVAAHIGQTRLIDNLLLGLDPRP